MERLNTLQRPAVLKELQSYKKYSGKTQKEITNQFNGIADLRAELYKLENKKHRHESKKLKTTSTSENKEEKQLPNDETYQFIGVQDVDLKILHLLKPKELYHFCQTNQYLYQLCQNDKILKKRVKETFHFIQFPMMSEQYYFVNRPDINIKKNGIVFNADKYDLLFKMNTVYCNVNGIIIYLCDFENQYFSDKIVIETPVKLTLIQIIKLIVKAFNTNMLEKFMKKYKKGAILMGMHYHHDGYYLLLDAYI